MPLYEVMDFLSETIRHKSTATNFPQTQVPITPPARSASIVKVNTGLWKSLSLQQLTYILIKHLCLCHRLHQPLQVVHPHQGADLHSPDLQKRRRKQVIRWMSC